MIFIIAAIAFSAFWFFFNQQIIGALRLLRIGELHLIGLFTDTIKIMPTNSAQPAQPYPVRKTLAWLQDSRASTLNWDQLTQISRTIVIQYLRIPCAVLLFMMGGIALFRAPNTRFRKTYDLDAMILAQGNDWKYTLPIIKFDPSKSEQRTPGAPVQRVLPSFSEALSPEEWLAWARVPVENGKPDRDAMRRAFVKQLGPRWQGPQKLPLHLQALFAAFALKGARKREEADKFLAEISEQWDPKKGLQLTLKQKSRIRGILNDPKIGGVATKIANHHGYTVPALVRVLLWCRMQGGVLAAAQFLWLRAEDRAVWYPLNNTGRRSFHSEAGGAMAHYLAEISLNRMLPMPKVDAAIAAVEDYMEETHVAIPPLQGKKSA